MDYLLPLQCPMKGGAIPVTHRNPLLLLIKSLIVYTSSSLPGILLKLNHNCYRVPSLTLRRHKYYIIDISKMIDYICIYIPTRIQLYKKEIPAFFTTEWTFYIANNNQKRPRTHSLKDRRLFNFLDPWSFHRRLTSSIITIKARMNIQSSQAIPQLESRLLPNALTSPYSPQ